MLALSFQDFYKGEYEDETSNPYQLYLIQNNDECLYIGISRSNVWNRWFASRNCHITTNIYKELIGNTTIGKFITDNLSENFKVSLYSLKDCYNLFYNKKIKKIEDVEPYMIQLYKPLLNKIFNN